MLRRSAPCTARPYRPTGPYRRTRTCYTDTAATQAQPGTARQPAAGSSSSIAGQQQHTEHTTAACWLCWRSRPGSTGCGSCGCSSTLQWGGCPAALAQAPFRGTTFHPAHGPHAGSHATPHGRSRGGPRGPRGGVRRGSIGGGGEYGLGRLNIRGKPLKRKDAPRLGPESCCCLRRGRCLGDQGRGGDVACLALRAGWAGGDEGSHAATEVPRTGARARGRRGGRRLRSGGRRDHGRGMCVRACVRACVRVWRWWAVRCGGAGGRYVAAAGCEMTESPPGLVGRRTLA
jgi:hypothetical protein